MLYRKISGVIEAYIKSNSDRMLVIQGARQIGKSFIIRHLGEKNYPNFIEINMEEDKLHDRLFAEARTTQDFYLALSTIAGDKLGTRNDTLVFIDEIQAYDHLLTLTKFLLRDNRFRYIASGSLLGIALRKTQSIPIGSLDIVDMYPMDFEEFLIANKVGPAAINTLKQHFIERKELSEAIHNKIIDLFKKYLIVGGLPKAVVAYTENQNIVEVRSVQKEVHELYEVDCTKYEDENNRKLKIRRIYDMIPSTLENKKKRIVVKDIEGKTWKRTLDYIDEFEYLIASGIALDDKAVTTPTYPLVENSSKNLIKLYLNDVGILSGLYYRNNIKAILDDNQSVNLGTIYETVVAQELKAHGYNLFYYDNKKNGEVDFLIDDAEHLTNIPIEVKSGKDYTIHSALTKFISNPDYHIHKAYVLSNERTIFDKNGITYIPVYFVMFF